MDGDSNVTIASTPDWVTERLRACDGAPEIKSLMACRCYSGGGHCCFGGGVLWFRWAAPGLIQFTFFVLDSYSNNWIVCLGIGGGGGAGHHPPLFFAFSFNWQRLPTQQTICDIPNCLEFHVARRCNSVHLYDTRIRWKFKIHHARFIHSWSLYEMRAIQSMQCIAFIAWIAWMEWNTCIA